MQLTLHTEGWFDAAHHLENYEGKCANMHGHTYKVEVWVRGDESLTNDAGILWDFGNLKEQLNRFDHKNLDEVFDCNSTAENQCILLYRTLKCNSPKLDFKVRVYEQLAPKKSYCECGDFK